MIRIFRHYGLEQLWKFGKSLDQKTLVAQAVLDVLDVIDAATDPRNVAFVGFQFHEWTETEQQRYGVMVSDRWLISFGWSDGHAIDVDLERID